jgi:flagellar operon protein
MNDKMTIGRLYPGRLAPPPGLKPKVQTPESKATFKEILDKQVLTFSQHAQARLMQRGITFSEQDIARIETAVDKAAAKGAKDSLIMMNRIALIVNVPNKTVVTAMDEASMQDHVFTQIDSAVIIPRS